MPVGHLLAAEARGQGQNTNRRASKDGEKASKEGFWPSINSVLRSRFAELKVLGFNFCEILGEAQRRQTHNTADKTTAEL